MSALSHNAVLRRAQDAQQLTSRQHFQVLDRMLTLALQPIQRESEVFLEWIAEILNSTVKSRRRNAAEMQAACATILSGAPGGLELLFNSGLDRGQALRFLERVRSIHRRMLDAEIELACSDDPIERVRHTKTIAECRAVLGHRPRLSPALTTSAYWHDHAAAWRNQIVDHYTKLLLKGAVGISRASGGRVEVDPTFHDAWIAAASSVNRFRSDQGVFAAFLGRSLKGTYRVAASNALGLAAPGARVPSDMALQTTALEDALELEDHTHVLQRADPVTLRALVVLGRVDVDVRAVLMLSDVDPVEAMHAMRIGPFVNLHPTGSTTQS